MNASKFHHDPEKPRNSQCQNAFSILCSAHLASSSFLDIFEKTRGQKKGTSTDEEQDLLRAMLAFASAGLDAMSILRNPIGGGVPELAMR